MKVIQTSLNRIQTISECDFGYFFGETMIDTVIEMMRERSKDEHQPMSSQESGPFEEPKFEIYEVAGSEKNAMLELDEMCDFKVYFPESNPKALKAKLNKKAISLNENTKKKILGYLSNRTLKKTSQS